MNKTLEDFPDAQSVKEFHERSGYTLDLSKDINENFLSYLDCLKRNDAFVVVTRIPRLGPFFTQNNIKNVLCLVRHPLHAYISFVGYQHPKAGAQFGELDAPKRIEWYAKQWNSMTTDYINSGNKIVRFEW